MAGVSARMTNNVCHKSGRHRAKITAVSALAAILAGSALIITEGPIHDGQLAELVALPLVLVLGCACGSLNDLVDEFLGVVHLFLCVSSD